MRRFQLWLLIFTAVWLVGLVFGMGLFINGLDASDISDNPGRDWATYPTGSEVWDFGFGARLAAASVTAAGVDLLTRLVSLIAWSLRRSRASAR